MKRLILMIVLLAPVHAFAGSCSGSDHIAVRYTLLNQSEHTIGLKFDQAEYGQNPGNIYLKSHSGPVDIYGCSDNVLMGYATKATLMTYAEPNVDLAYLYFEKPYFDRGSFSYEDQNPMHPQCSCKIRLGLSWARMESYVCASYVIPPILKTRVEVRIHCK